jgi:ATP-binding cassette subfamily B protein
VTSEQIEYFKDVPGVELSGISSRTRVRAENIAFGVSPENIEMKRVKEAARQAHIADFIESSVQGYQALAGERGIRLSGGQCQRIGIARAL